jgi:hypothetical protein
MFGNLFNLDILMMHLIHYSRMLNFIFNNNNNNNKYLIIIFVIDDLNIFFFTLYQFINN